MLIYVAWLLFIVGYYVYQFNNQNELCREYCQILGINDPINTLSNICLISAAHIVRHTHCKRIFIALCFASTIHHGHYECSKFEDRLDVGILIYFLLHIPEFLFGEKPNYTIILLISIFWKEWKYELDIPWVLMYAMFGLYVIGCVGIYAYYWHCRYIYSTLDTRTLCLCLGVINASICMATASNISTQLFDVTTLICITSSIAHSISTHIVLPLVFAIVLNSTYSYE